MVAALRTNWKRLVIPHSSMLSLCAVLLGIGLNVWCFNPGYVDLDSAWQYKQAIEGKLTDLHPPIMSYLWSWFNKFLPGPIGMLLFHNMMFWSGLGVVVTASFRRSFLAPILILAIGFFPPIFSSLGTIWKSTGMASSFLCALGMFLLAQHRESKWAFFMGLLGLYYGCSVRHEAIAAVAPFSLWGGYIFCKLWRPTASRLFKYTCGIALCIALWISMEVTSLMLVPMGRDFLGILPRPFQESFVHDLVAISVRTDHIYLPTYLNPPEDPVPMSFLKRVYTPYNVFFLFYIPYGATQRNRIFPFTSHKENLIDLVQTWWRTVSTHPAIYLSHRWIYFRGLLGLEPKAPRRTYHSPDDLRLIGFEFKANPFNRWMTRLMWWSDQTILFQPWIYLVVIMVFVGWSFVRFSEGTLPCVAIGLSALFHMAGFFIIGSMSNFHYSVWTVCVALILPVILFSRRSRSARVSTFIGEPIDTETNPSEVF